MTRSPFHTTAKILATLSLILSLAGSALGADPLSDAEERGRHIYTKGESTSGRVITAEVQMSAAPASGSILPCAQCHGINGEGIGDVAPGVRWSQLTDPAAHEHPQRTHAPFNAISFATLVRKGIDPSGNQLEPTMPRYRMSDPDIADLVAYLKRIGESSDPGISETTIRIGTVLPTAGPTAGIGNAMREVLQASVRRANEAGGIHGRQLELVVGEYGAKDTPAFWEVLEFVQRESLFALVGSYLPGYEADLSKLVLENELPHVGPNYLMSNAEGGRFEFFVQPSLVEQAFALADVALRATGQDRFAVVYPRIDGFDGLAADIRARFRDGGANAAFEVPFAINAFDGNAVVGQLQAAGVDTVVYLGPPDSLLALARAAQSKAWHPSLLAPALYAERVVFELPAAFDDRVWLAYPSLPDDRTEAGVRAFETLHEDFGFGYEYSLAQMAAFSAVRVLIEGLEIAGRDLTREGLLEALESLEGFEPGLTPAMTFDAARRIGVNGAHVLRVDIDGGRLDADKRWIELTEVPGESKR